MRHKLACVIAAVSFTAVQSASAADMPAKAPAYKAPLATATPWTGFYVNGGVGYGMWTADSTVSIPGVGCLYCETQVLGGRGWLATIGAGYDYQFAPRIVAGIFGEASASSLKGTILDRDVAGAGDIKQTSSWAGGGRVGWLVTPQTLSYVNAGYTAARFSSANLAFTSTGTPTGFSTPGFTAKGWFLGGGVETSLAPNWFWRTEYRYAYYRNTTLAESPAAFNIDFKPTVQTVTSQIVYKFNGGIPAPVYPATPAAPTKWTGFYVNAGAGYGLWHRVRSRRNGGELKLTAVVAGGGLLDPRGGVGECDSGPGYRGPARIANGTHNRPGIDLSGRGCGE